MLVTCWSVKGGSGCSLVAGALALTLTRLGHEVLIVDLGGDLPAVLGLPETDQPGLSEWLSAGADVPADGLARVEVAAGPGLALVPRGGRPVTEAAGRGDRLRVLAGLLTTADRTVVVDAGLLSTGARVLPLVVEAHRALLVTRACFLALRRLTASPARPSGVVLVAEPGRALDRADVEEVAGAPVVAEVPFDPAVARAVDAGLLAGRLPNRLERALRPAVR